MLILGSVPLDAFVLSGLTCAQEMGADIIVDISKEDPLKVVLENSKGEGADAVCECAGVADSLDSCWEAVRRGGTLTASGNLSWKDSYGL